MKFIQILYTFLILLSSSSLILGEIIIKNTITFKDEEQKLEISKGNLFKIPASFSRDNKERYLHIFTNNIEDDSVPNKAAFKIYFKEYSEAEKNINYIKSDYSTLDLNSGLFIKIGDIEYDKASIFINAFDDCEFIFHYKYADKITFPSYNYYSNFLSNQFILPKGKDINIEYKWNNVEKNNEYLMIFSKTSLRNIGITITYNTKDVTDEKGAYIYPNGYSIFLDKEELDENVQVINVKITNNNNKNEVIILGYMHSNQKKIFPNPIFNGFQINLEGNKNEISLLKNSGNSNIKDQYFLYQTYTKNIFILFENSNNVELINHKITEYNSMFHYNLVANGNIRFDFKNTAKRSSLNFQYLDYTDLETTQKLLLPLVTGSPKSMLIPSKKSMYHFLPIEGESTNLNYYLRPKGSNNMYISFKTCTNYPEECYFEQEDDKNKIVPFIDNLGLWYTQPTNKSELQLIYVYCSEECSYDIIMTYDNDPLFLFPDNNYTKFIDNNERDTFLLPVFEYLENFETIKIDLSIISGNAKLTLYNSREGTKLNYNSEIIGRKQSYTITKDTFVKEIYYKKEIYAVVEGDKNTFYNLMYITALSQNKVLDNNRVITELLTVPNKNNIAEYTKTFTFVNNDGNMYISITTPTCESHAEVGTNKGEGNSINFSVTTKGNVEVKIYLKNDEIICNEGFEEEVTIFAYTSSKQNILLSENTLVNSTFNEKDIKFIHIFKPSDIETDDNSLNVDIEKLSENSLTLSYSLERISFNRTEPKELSFSRSQSIISTKSIILSNNLINNYCGSLSQNEICKLSMTFSTSGNSQKFSLYLNKNGRKYIRPVNKALVTSSNSKSIQYYYIDLNKNYDTEVLINSYEQDLEIEHVFYSDNIKIDEGNLPTKFTQTTNYLKISQEKPNNCGLYCRLYIAVRIPQNSNKKEVYTHFSISYLYKNSDTVSEINLPLNYYSQYSFTDSGPTKVNYYVSIYQSSSISIELFVVKQNENDNSEVTATLSGTNAKSLTSSKRFLNEDVSKNIKITVEYSGNDKPTFQLKVSTLGEKLSSPVIPILSSFSEKCNSKTCYYAVDISKDIEEEYAYFYVPEAEDAIIYIQQFKDNINQISKYLDSSSKYEISSDNEIKRTNWYQYKLGDKGYVLLIKVEKKTAIESTFSASFYSKPNQVTINYGEKRTFIIGQSVDIESILLRIKGNSPNNKYKINIHAIRGNGIFIHNNEKYIIGLNSTYKEDMTIIINEGKISNLELNATNEKDGAADKQDFVFTIEYTINTESEFVNQIENNKVNSFKIMNSVKLNDLFFYMKAENSNKIYNDVSMNLKIYSNTSTYDIKSYIGDESLINKITEVKNGNSKGEIKTFITGGPSKGDLTFARLTIPSSQFTNTENKDQYVYIVISQNEKNSEKVKIDLYPYNMTNNSPLARNQLFAQKIPSKTTDYQLLLVKSDIDYSQEITINIIKPLSKKYEYGIAASNEITNEKIKRVDDGLVKTEYNLYGKSIISLNPSNHRYILYNIYSKETEENEDLLIFSYQNQFLTEQSIYGGVSEVNFNVSGNKNNIEMKITEIPSKYKGKTTYIFNAYEKSKVDGIDINENHKPLYLLFSEIQPTYNSYRILESDEYKSKTYKESNFNHIGEYYFTCIAIIEDNEREEYLGFGFNLNVVDNEEEEYGLLDYMKSHILATIIIIIVLLCLVAMMVNICRVERRSRGSGRNGAAYIEVSGELMKEM